MAAWSDRQTWRGLADAQRRHDATVMQGMSNATLRNLIANERENGRAFGRVAEMCRYELAKRGQNG